MLESFFWRLALRGSVLAVSWNVLEWLLPTLRRRSCKRSLPEVQKVLPHLFHPGARVLLLGPQGGALEEISKLALENNCFVLDNDCLQEIPDSSLDVVVLDRYLSSLTLSEARQQFGSLCQLLKPGTGRLVVQDLAVLPPSMTIYWAGLLSYTLGKFWRWLLVSDTQEQELPGGPYDNAEFLPRNFVVESRQDAGWLQELLLSRRLSEAPDEAVERLRRSYGNNSMQFCTSTVANRIGQPEESIRYFLGSGEGADATGYIAYLEYVRFGKRLRLVLMDPVAEPAQQEALIREFLLDCDRCQIRPIFSCVTSEWLDALRTCGLHTTMLGAEVGISLKDYILSKDRRRYLRAAPAKGLECHKECYDFEELEELNASWVNGKAAGAEVLIWTWPPSLPKTASEGKALDDEVKRLFTYQDGKLVGFVCAEPYYKPDGSGEVLGYGLNSIRFRSNLSPPWISDFTVATLIQDLQEEGKAEYLAFGFSPFSEIQAYDNDVAWLRAANKFAWSTNAEAVYPIHSLAKKKAHHCAGQGMRLHDRFASADPAYVFIDTVRFLSLLFGQNPEKLPAAGAVAIQGLVAKGVGHLSSAIRSFLHSRGFGSKPKGSHSQKHIPASSRNNNNNNKNENENSKDLQTLPSKRVAAIATETSLADAGVDASSSKSSQKVQSSSSRRRRLEVASRIGGA